MVCPRFLASSSLITSIAATSSCFPVFFGSSPSKFACSHGNRGGGPDNEDGADESEDDDNADTNVETNFPLLHSEVYNLEYVNDPGPRGDDVDDTTGTSIPRPSQK